MTNAAVRADHSADYQFTGQDIPLLLAQRARDRGAHPFLLWEPESGIGRTWTYAQFHDDVQRLAGGLHARGISRGDRLLIHSGNCPEMLIAWYACATVGAIAVTTNTHAVAAEFVHYARQAQPRAAITQPRYARLLRENIGAVDWIAVTADDSGEAPAADSATTGLDRFDDLFRHDVRAPSRPAEPMMPAGIIYTSGTTSLPKAVLHSHGNLLWAARIGPVHWNFGPENVHITFMPLFHTNAQMWTVAVVLGAGGSVVLLPRTRVRGFWEVVVKHGVTHATVGQLAKLGLNALPVPAGQRLKILHSGSGHHAFAARCGAKGIAAYGSSETVTTSIRTDLLHTWPEASVGQATPGYELRVVDGASGIDRGPEQPGELLVRGVRGVQMFLEYYNNPEATAKAFTDDGWFRTGDIAKRDAEGNYYFLDRDKDRLKVGGENVSASEVERVIAGVAGVVEAAVVAQRDAALDMVPVAFVIRSPTAPAEETLREQILGQCLVRLSAFKRPRAVWFVENFPRALLDKVAKNVLRERAEALRESIESTKELS